MGPHRIELVHPVPLPGRGQLAELTHLDAPLQAGADKTVRGDVFQGQCHKGERIRFQPQDLVEGIIFLEVGPPVALGAPVDG